MSSYVVLARRCRPRSFEALIGQQHVVQALKNGLASGRVPHAFLFSGTRGVGKTTLARILAMRLNCQTTQTPEPCGTCASCQEVIAGSHPDVMEIDAASRTKVEQMRELLELAPYAPASSPFKVFILDEIHMLSTQSFNALLKTLEEPPAHVKFIFATTEPRKIPATILSRCQRHDLKRVTALTLTKHLETILNNDQIPWDALGLQAVVRAADGSVRDGLSLLDQVIAHGNGEVRYEAVHTLLGLTDQEAVTRLLDQVLTGQGPEVLTSVEQFHAGGVEPAALVRDLLNQVHQRTRTRVTTIQLGDGPSLEHLQMVYQTLLKGEGEIKLADQPSQALEMLLLRAAYLRPIPELDKLIAALGSGSGPMTPVGRITGGGVTSTSGSVVVTSKSVALPPSPLPITLSSSLKSLTSWDQLVSFASEQAPEVGRKIRGQVVCLDFGTSPEGGLTSLRLRFVDDCFGTPERMRTLVTDFLQGQGMTAVRVVVEPASAGSRPESLQEHTERLDKEYRLRLEGEVNERPEVQQLMKCFAAKLIAVEPLSGLGGPNR
ncbi:MAG: DNA polymerase III subunit gamma/tau [Magnetococcales bacterium]|nr:DNA polymerase III subunit gamma/tau [Magnetococcales bacterium]